jgi:hypothetical protein
MAKQKRNVITHGTSGKVGGLVVFRQLKGGRTVLANIPELQEGREMSEKQVEQQSKFQKAVVYAQVATHVPETEQLYADAAKKNPKLSAYNIAIADYLNAPDIKMVDLSVFTGLKGSEIRIVASDDFLVKNVQVEIYDVDGVLLENGEANNLAGDLWIYTATVDNQNTTGVKIVVSASDLPGNITKKDITLE